MEGENVYGKRGCDIVVVFVFVCILDFGYGGYGYFSVVNCVWFFVVFCFVCD